MIGRNDPCLCGSGKKYKRCCLGKSEPNLETLIDEELERVLHGFYEQTRNRTEIVQFDRYRKQWTERLGELWDAKSIEVAATEYFLFIVRQGLWQQYLQQVLISPLRDAVREVVETWHDPVIIFGKVTSEQDGFVQVKEIFGKETFYLETGEAMEKEKDIVVFGVGLRNPRKHPKAIYALTSFMFIKDVNQSFENSVVQLAEANDMKVDVDFYEEHMVDIYESMLNRDNTSIDDLVSTKLSDEQQEALTMIQDVLEDVEAISDAQELLRNISITYFLKEKPRFRKPNVIAAAVFSVALELKILGELTMTNAEVAKRFDVSTSSIKTHADRIHKFVSEMLEQTKEK